MQDTNGTSMIYPILSHQRIRLIMKPILYTLILFIPFQTSQAKEKKLDNPAQRWSESGQAGVPSFQRHVVPLMTRAGCNNRSCHGSFQGKGGFQLSLFGYEPELDHKALLAEDRINLKSPDESLALLKPLREVSHKGGQRFTKDSWQHRLFRSWIESGAKNTPMPTLSKLQLTPTRIRLEPGKQLSLQVIAHFEDGNQEDVTPLTMFSSNDESVIRVDAEGRVTITGTGSTAIVAKYSTGIATAQVIAPFSSAKDFPTYPTNNRIDTLVASHLRELGIHPSKLSSDEAFLRRAYLDVIGTLPTAEEARAYLKNKQPDKRERLIDQLLMRDEHSLYWATIFSDWLGNNQSNINNFFKMTHLFHSWLHDKLSRNVRYDEIVKGIITATSREGRPLKTYLAENKKVNDKITPRAGFDDGTYAKRKTLDLFWLRRVPDRPKELAIRTANALLGVQIQCAECHNHPFDRWTKADFEGYTSFFRVVEITDLDGSPRSGRRYDYDKVALYAGAEKRYTGQIRKFPPKLLGSSVVPYSDKGPDPRESLFQWMVSSKNPYFARNIVNRVWHHYFGVGIVDPIDDLSEANPPSNPSLFNWLANDFIESGFDLRHLHRRILRSRTYQLSHLPNESNRNDKRNFSHALVRRMPAEVALDAIAQVTGTELRWNSYSAPAGSRAIGVPTPVRTGKGDYFLQIFGKPKRQQTCACERSNQSALAQALFMINDADVHTRISSSKGILPQLLKKYSDNRKLIEELTLRSLSRYPRPEEMQQILKYISQASSRQEAMEDVLWSLLNVREFLFVR